MKRIIHAILCRLGFHDWQPIDTPWCERCRHCGKTCANYGGWRL